MAKYRAVMTAFGLSRGDTFESNDPRWAQQVEAGNLAHVDEDVSLSLVDDTLSPEEVERLLAEGNPDGGGDGE